MSGSNSENNPLKRHSASTRKKKMFASSWDSDTGYNSGSQSPLLLTKRNLQAMRNLHTSTIHSKGENDGSVTTLGSKLSETTKERIRRIHGVPKSKSLHTMKSISFRPQKEMEYDCLSETTLGSKFSEGTKEKIRRLQGVPSKSRTGTRNSQKTSTIRVEDGKDEDDSQNTILDPSVFSIEYIAKRKAEKKKRA